MKQSSSIRNPHCVTAALVTIAWVFIVSTALPFVKGTAWWIRVFDFPRSQIGFCAFVTWVLLFWLGDPGPLRTTTLVILGAATLYQFWEMSAYTPLRRRASLEPETTEPERRVRILIANILMTNRSSNEYLKVIAERSPDLILLAEADTWWEEQLRPIERDYPHSIKAPLSNTYGMLLYSRFALSESKVRYLVEPDVPSFHTLVRLPIGEVFELFCVHPRPPRPGDDTDERDAELVVIAKEIAKTTRPAVVSGDLNDVAWSHTTRLFLRLSKMLDPRLGRSFCNTFPVNNPIFRWPLDHLFHSRAFRLAALERMPACGSDHFPVFVELSFEPEVRHDQERPQADAEDHREAREKLERVGLL